MAEGTTGTDSALSISPYDLRNYLLVTVASDPRIVVSVTGHDVAVISRPSPNPPEFHGQLLSAQREGRLTGERENLRQWLLLFVP
jgi:hypothetical protein